MSSELRRRVVTALVALPPCVALLWLGGWPAAALFSVASGLACREFLRLAPPQQGTPGGVVVLGAMVLPWLPVWSAPHAFEIALLLIAATSLFAWSWHVVHHDVTGAASEAPMLVQALVFCALGPFFLSELRSGLAGRAWTLAVVAVTFANDTGAYFIGKRWGRHHFAPRVSPGKTWEGLAGGAVASAAMAFGAAAWWPEVLRPADAVILALVCSTLGPLGDLSKSALKRARGVKDAGALLPGHGGVLDRIDALVVNVPAIWAWVTWGR